MIIAFASEPGGPAFPQLHFDYWPSQIFWLLVALVALYFILTRVALPRIRSTLEERRDTISSDLDKAAEFNLAAEEAEDAYDKALHDARAEAQKIAEKTKSEIKERLDVAVAEADKRIAAKVAESEATLKAIQDEAADKAREVAVSTADALVARFSPSEVSTVDVEAAVAANLSRQIGG